MAFQLQPHYGIVEAVELQNFKPGAIGFFFVSYPSVLSILALLILCCRFIRSIVNLVSFLTGLTSLLGLYVVGILPSQFGCAALIIMINIEF